MQRRSSTQHRKTSGRGRRRSSVAEQLEHRLLFSTTFLVTNTADSGAGSLRQAIASANQTGGTTIIDFSIGSGVQTINTLSPLPNLGTNITIDGTTQPGYAGTPLIVINGALAGSSTYGIDVSGGGCTILGLAIDSFGNSGIYLAGWGWNTVQGNYIGVAPGGSTAAGNGGDGVLITSPDNLIGGTTASNRNIISGNTVQGVDVNSSYATANQVEGNYIGTNAAGNAAVPNEVSGVCIFDANNNTIGGSAQGDGNLISGNSQDGVVTGGSTNGNVVAGNLIGTNAAGNSALPNGFYGIEMDSGYNTIGGLTAGARNVVSGNAQDGVVLFLAPAVQNIVEGNYIGTDVTGTYSIGVQPNGVDLDFGASNNTIGGTSAAARNVISGNLDNGVGLFGAGTTANVVQGNYIGTTASGLSPLGNGLVEPGGLGAGVLATSGAEGNTIGGTSGGAGNLISSNGTGVALFGASGSAAGNTVQGNIIGANASGAANLPNVGDGVQLFGNNNTIGGYQSGAANTIYGNTNNAIVISSGSGNVIGGNTIAPASGTVSNPTPTQPVGSLGDSDIGYPGQTGSASYNSGIYTLSGGGQDIWNSTDQYNFAYTSVTSNATLIAEVTSLSNTDPWAKAGLMFRDGTSSSAANVAVVATPGNGVSFQWRASLGAASSNTNIGSIPIPSASAPVWLELTRAGSVFTALYSTNGTTYTVLGSQTISMSTTLLGGLAVTSHNSGLLATATFANVAIPVSSAPVTIPGTPVLAAAAATGAISLSWSSVSGASTYNLYRSTTPGGEGTTPYLTGLTGTSYADSAVIAGTPYYYTLTAVNTAGQSSQSTETSATPLAVPPSSTGPLSDADIGSPGKTGSASFNSSTGVYTVSGGGSDIWGTSDQFNFASTSVAGNATLTAEVTSLAVTDPWAKAGLMFRDGSTASAANVAVVATPGNGVSFQWRATPGGSSGYANIGSIPAPTPSAPVWLQLTRNGNIFTASYSTNGIAYTVIGTQTITLSNSLLAGLVVTSHNNGLLATANFANVAVPVSSAPVTIPAIPTLGATAATGAVNLSWSSVSGATSYNLYRSTVSGAEGTTPYLTGLTGSTYSDTAVTAGTPYYYTLTAVNSAGQSSQSTETSATPLAVPPSSTGPLSDADIGSPGKTGSASFNSSTGVYIVSGGGSDIWSNSDQFNFDSTSIAGNATLTAEVTSLTVTDPWAKAGLMFRDGSSASAANVAVVATPGNGVSFQWRTTPGGSSGYANIGSIPAPTSSAPIWLQLTRNGNIFTASYSTNGTTYTVIGTQTITLSNSLLAGLVVTSHNNGLLTTANFANVAVPVSSAPVTIPAIPTLGATAATGAVNLSWSSVSGATSYNLYRSTVSGAEGFTPYLTGLTGTSYSDTAVTAGTPYYYTLTAVNTAGQSSQSTETSATPLAVPPSSTGPLSDADIGLPGQAGSASFNSSTGVYTVTGGGSDIWTSNDQFNFASMTVAGNATLTAEITSLSNTNSWTKAGLMFRDGLSASAPNVTLLATPGNGASFQWRAYNGDSTASIIAPTVPAPTAASPIWLQLTRSGNVFTASYSTNGTTFTVIGSETIALDSALSAGLAVTAHNNSLLATGTFANVNI